MERTQLGGDGYYSRFGEGKDGVAMVGLSKSKDIEEFDKGGDGGFGGGSFKSRCEECAQGDSRPVGMIT